MLRLLECQTDETLETEDLVVSVDTTEVTTVVIIVIEGQEVTHEVVSEEVNNMFIKLFIDLIFQN